MKKYIEFQNNKVAIRSIALLTAIVLSSSCNATKSVVQEPTAILNNKECVVLLHGLGRTSRSMNELQEALVNEGYLTANLDYPSREKKIENIALEDFPRGVAECQKYAPVAIHFVTHSLGGIVLRMALSEQRPHHLGRVVMLSPPNKGSHIVDEIGDWSLYKWLNGPAGQQLSTHTTSAPNQLGSVDYPVGIITGDQHAFFDAWFASFIPGADDGKVSVENAQVEGMHDFLVVHEAHSFIMESDYVHRQTIHFLKNGFFNHTQELNPLDTKKD